MSHDYSTSLNIAHIEARCCIYGPGLRYVIWFQGCSLQCPGCWNQGMWSTQPNMLIERDVLLEQILVEKGIDGVTFLGGEPLQQPDNLLWLLCHLKERDVHIMLYTGYENDEISSDQLYHEICQLADILIIGRYHEHERDLFLQWRGSRNQRVLIRDGKTQCSDGINQIEIVIDEDGTIKCLGYPADTIIDAFL